MKGMKQTLCMAGLVSMQAFAQTGWKAELKAALTAKYAITERNWMGEIKKPGTIILVQKDGLKTDRPQVMMKPTIIKDGELASSGAGGLVTGIGGRSLKQGDRLYIVDIRVDDEYVLLLIQSVNTIDQVENGNTKSVKQQAAVSFAFEKGKLATMPAKEVISHIERWFSIEGEKAAPKSISLGQTTDEVTKTFGQPEKIVNLGEKTIFTYKDMKVVFVKGKVTDVQ